MYMDIHEVKGATAEAVAKAHSADVMTQSKSGVEYRERAIKVRIGAAAGEPVESHQDLFGSTVQLAARLCAHAAPDQSLVSTAIAELCIGKGLTFQDLGEVSLKGFDRPIRVHAIQQPREAAPARSGA
jgi:class 3 adenylate cyclase